VYTGFALNALTEVTCDDDGGPGLTSLANFPKGTADDFYFQIGRKNGTADGDLEFQFDISNCGNSIGCRNIPMAGPCEDGNPCTTGDSCDTDFGTCTPGSPVLADADTDGICDPGDNCPFVSNEEQTQSDTLPAGDACQCGDLDIDGDIDDADVTIARRVLVDSSLANGVPRTRCNVIGLSDGGIDDCDVQDIAQLARHAGGSAAQIDNVCDAYLNP
jgi:hypothetical protein